MARIDSTNGQRRRFAAVLFVALVFSAPVLSGAQAADGASEHSAHESSAKGKSKGSPSHQMHHSMMDGMKGMSKMRMTGDMDRDFAMMMKKHHEDGLKMAQHELDHGKDAKMREMAKNIMDAQKKEIAEFDQWLNAKGGGKK